MRATVLACAIGTLAGCAATGPRDAAFRPLATFGVAENLPRIVAYGSLGRLVPQYNPTPALDAFLYGPTEPPGLMLRNPQGLTMLGGKLLVCDQGYMAILGIDLATGRSIGWEDADHRPRCPVAITTGPAGRVYVADTTLGGVLVYESDGNFIEMLAPTAAATAAAAATVPDATFRPCSVLVRDNVLYVGNLAAHRVDRYDVAGRAWLPPMQPPTVGPAPAAPTGLAMTGDGVLLIADALLGRILRVGPDGNWLEPIGEPGRLEGQFVRPKYVACTPSGLIVVTDAGRQSLMVFDGDGAFVTEVIGRDRAWPGFTLPAGVLALPAEGLDVLMRTAGGQSRNDISPPEPHPDEWIIVTDTLNARSVALFGVMLPQARRAADAAR